ncbi:MAG: exonuclease SbcCD subunit D, partial [Caldimicrobium sp.]
YAELLKELSTLNIPCFLILGNHDSKRTSLHSYFLEKAKIYLIDHINYFPFTFQDEKGERVFLYFLPYLPVYEFLEKIKEVFSFELPEKITYTNLLKIWFEKIEFKEPAFFISHFTLEKFHPSGEEIMIKGFSEEYVMQEELLSPFAFVFLGHLHRPQEKGKIFYPGAPLPYSFEVSKEERGVYFFEWKKGSFLLKEFIPLTPSYELLYLQGSLEEILRTESTSAYVKVVLKEERPVMDAYERLKNHFPNLLALEYESSQPTLESSFESFYVNPEAIKIDEKELFKEFYKLVKGKEVDPKLWEVFLKGLEEFYSLQRKEERLWQ